MTSRSALARYGFLMLAALAGCSPDRVAAPRVHHPANPAADIANLGATDPILFDQYSSDPGRMAVWTSVGAHMGEDFVVPAGETWSVRQVVVSGVLSAATLPFAIRTNNDGVPGAIIQSFDLAPTASDENPCGCYYGTDPHHMDYLFTLPTAVMLTPGTYWLTVGPLVTPAFSWLDHDPVGLWAQSSMDNGSSWGMDYGHAFVLFGARRVPQTITFSPVTPNPAPVGSAATLAATASSNLTVAFAAGPTAVCTLSGTTLSYVGVGTCTVTADQAGSDSYFPATPVIQDIVVGKLSQTVAFTSTPPNPGYVNGTYLVATTGGASGNPVTVTAGPPNVCTAAGQTVRFIGVGTCTLTTNQSGNSTYDAAAPVSQTVKVDYRYDGFLGSVKNDVVNGAKAGQAIPLQWRLTDVNGTPITTLASVKITVTDVKCALGSTTDQVAERAEGASGLQNLGNGFYQSNWKSPASYALSCKILQLDLGEGSGARTASFVFVK